MENRKIINLTNHDITILTRNNEKVVIPRDGQIRCSISRLKIDTLVYNGVEIPINNTTLGDVPGLPEERDDTIIIVSAITAEALKGKRNDIYTVDEPVRENYRVVGCKSLAKNK